MKDIRRNFMMALFALYCVVMAWLLFDRSGSVEGLAYWEQVEMNLNLEPMVTVKRYLRVLSGPYSDYLQRHAFVNLFGNVGMFIPLGWFLPEVFEKQRKYWKTFLTSALLICGVEVTQLFTLRGSCDVDDLILNLVGVTLGYILYKLFGPKGQKKG